MPKCVDCLFFKTRVITKSNLAKLDFNRIGKIEKVLTRKKDCRIYWCEYSLTPDELYVEYDEKISKTAPALTIEIPHRKLADYFPQ